jgi:hypothetical protein
MLGCWGEMPSAGIFWRRRLVAKLLAPEAGVRFTRRPGIYSKRRVNASTL